MYAMRVGEKSRDEDAVGLMVPIVCLLATFTVGLLLAFLYVRKRRLVEFDLLRNKLQEACFH